MMTVAHNTKIEALLSNVGIQRCPACRYDLRGLPTPHRCPECGLAYDEKTLCLRPKNRLIVAVDIIMAISMPLVALSLIDKARSGFSGLSWSDLGFIAGLWFCGTRGYHYYATRRSPQFLLLRADGIQWRIGRTSTQTIPWTSVENVSWIKLGGSVALRLRDGKTVWVPWEFRSPFLPLKDFGELIRRYWQEGSK